MPIQKSETLLSLKFLSAAMLMGSLVGCADEVVAFADLVDESMYEGEDWGYQSDWDVKPGSLVVTSVLHGGSLRPVRFAKPGSKETMPPSRLF